MDTSMAQKKSESGSLGTAMSQRKKKKKTT